MIKLILIFSLCMTAEASIVYADIAVIVNSKNTTDWNTENTSSSVKAIFLGSKEKFPDGSIAMPVDQSEEKNIRKEFYIKLANKNETAMNIYWSNLIFTGKGRPPKTIGDDSSVKKFVNENINGIGYIDSTSIDKTVKVIHTIK